MQIAYRRTLCMSSWKLVTSGESNGYRMTKAELPSSKVLMLKGNFIDSRGSANNHTVFR